MDSRFNRQSIKLPWNGLVAIAGCLLFVHATLDFQRERYGHLSISLLFWIAIAALISDRRGELKLTSDQVSAVIGTLLLVALMGIAITKPRDLVLGFYPLISAVGLGLLASGIRELWQYKKEFLGLFCLGFPELISPHALNIAPVTAAVTSTLMWYAGFPVHRQGILLSLPPGGSVRVVAECSGLNLMLYMFGVSVVFLMLFPTTRRNTIGVPILAIALGFMLNTIRVGLLAFLSSSGNQAAFDYWHSNEGALFFVLVSVGLFGLLCWVLLSLRSK